MDGVALARVLHVLGVVVWIGGVAMVTAVVLPAARSLGPPDIRIRVFGAMEHRFAWIARGMVLIVGASGFYMVSALDLWDRFASPAFWWMHAMVAIWAIFAFVLFVAEPLFLHRRLGERARQDPEGTFALMQRFHWIMLLASLITIAGAMAGAHGYGLLE